MNKEKLIEAKKVVTYEIGQSLEKVQNTGIDFSTKMTIAAVLGTLTATLEDKLDDIIQSEPEETFKYTKEQVAELMLEYALDLENSKNFACDMDTADVIYWLNEKAGE